MKIQDVSRQLGMTTRSIRYYEERGLLGAISKEENGYRVFREEDVERLKLIGWLRELGMSIEDIRSCLDEAMVGDMTAIRVHMMRRRKAFVEEIVQLKLLIQQMDQLIHIPGNTEGNLLAMKLEQAAEQAKRVDKVRNSWEDKWDFDSLAKQYDTKVKDVEHKQSLTCEQQGHEQANAHNHGEGNTHGHAQSHGCGHSHGHSHDHSEGHSHGHSHSHSQENAHGQGHSNKHSHSHGHSHGPVDYNGALQRASELANIKPGDRGLDLGIGTGNLTTYCLSKGAIMTGVDQSEQMIERCREKWPSVRLLLGNMMALPVVNETFDFVVSSFALHHMTDEQQQIALQEIDQVVVPGSRVVLADLMFEDEDHRQSYYADVLQSGRKDQIEKMSKVDYPDCSNLLAWLRSNGYEAEVEQLDTLTSIVYAIKQRA
ncbi:MerR family transcriptional regulator [Paenibacillus agilis]|uniref:MerR family transcriptional regulator n=1 Tax=Paenibacillus agilis TaxID=3020863 RepID=A0A559IHC7_9BACL|nr:MerR family transcriptional regulator [Paenibacillus agilis]TVX87062.1 MerR family transcriptional regulator [Paenibacillus agilis]